jgi:para-nitrobenzyl esterase
MKLFSRRQFIDRIALTAGVVPLLQHRYLTNGKISPQGETREYVDIEITHGKIRGVRIEGVNIFKGIPYAGKVSAEKRFRKPSPPEPWSGIREALEVGAPAMQSPRRNEPAPSEDCLFLNVWTPANDNKKRPVMFYNHGGGYLIGSGGKSSQDGSSLARYFDVVVVETNHRLGIFGFLFLDEIAGPEYAGSGNMGLIDIAAGLKWVNENISVFGGDPDNVMIFGESGGGGKTSCLYAMPAAAPYFNKASIESGPGVRMLSPETARQTTDRVLKELNIAPKDWRKLLEVPAAGLLAIQKNFPMIPPYLERRNTDNTTETFSGGFGPVVDGVALLSDPFDPVAPLNSENKPLMVGWNEDEYTFIAWEMKDSESFKINFDQLQSKLESQFGKDTGTIISAYRKARPQASAPDILVAVSSIAMMGLGSVEIAERKARQNGAPVYLYNFGYKSEVKIPGTDYPLGTPHAMDIRFKFYNEDIPKDETQPEAGFGGSRPERFVASRNMAELWTSFARTGKPSAKGAPDWTAYNLKDRPTMRIDTKCEVIPNRYSIELDMWRSIGKLS